MAMVQTGLDLLVQEDFARLRKQRLGLLAHPASIDHACRPILDLFHGAHLDLRVLFGPEHGLDGRAQDMEPVSSAAPGDSVPIKSLSLYGHDEASLRPPLDCLTDLDCLVIDLQDVGARYYTFATTMRYCLEACAQTGIRAMVLDRPNPINGRDREGPGLNPGYESFVGGFDVPIRHGLTMAELARLAAVHLPDLELSIVAMNGWRRQMWFDQTGLPWVWPSPNMPTLDTATVYPGMCLVEATNLSEGRGTTRPFELVGAPWLAGSQLAAELNLADLPGVRFRSLSFKPSFHKHAGVLCHGVQLHLVDRDAFRPLRTGLKVLQYARRQAPDMFSWRTEPYEFRTEPPAMDLLTGTDRVRTVLDDDGDPDALVREWLSAPGCAESKSYPDLLY